ncbi:uncharacterized protein LOC128246410 [Mya arenaria]|uniref:uncharacterized protein LOC128246410 n=1 Tax=Mya arenaria TaxID=6604 RepID=UPI0022E14730|nr:uncharacterized protein LOC128246410 [Mya arenaria]
MAGYIIVDVKTKKTVAICAAIGVGVFVIGILIGFFSGKGHGSNSAAISQSDQPTAAEELLAECTWSLAESSSGLRFVERYIERHSEKNICVENSEQCMDLALPRHYIAYHLNTADITIDGKLDEKAWDEVEWSENFVDMRSVVYPDPYYTTKFKMRWDNDRLYVGAVLQERDFWATNTKHDSNIWQENGFEMLVDVDGTMFNYKQMQINVLGTMMDQVLFKSPYDQIGNESIREKEWHPDARKEVYVDGTVNKPGDIDKYWSVEMALSFDNLKDHSERVQPNPIDDEVCFVQFGRSEQHLENVNGEYRKKKNSTTDWWAWQPCDAINLHLQDRWGLVQFKRTLADNEFKFTKWHIYKSLFDMMNGMKKYKALHGRYVNTIEELDIPPYLLSRNCVDIPEIRIEDRNGTKGFDITVKSMFLSHKPAHIREDRYVYFK